MDRPQLSEYQDPVKFIKDMIYYRKVTERNFNVKTACTNLRRLSPSLVSLILAKHRRITVDRCEAISKLLGLSSREKFYFKDWIESTENPHKEDPVSRASASDSRSKKQVSSHILSDWVNVYVKDAFRLASVQQSFTSIYSALAGLATKKRIDRAINFLLREGYLKKTPDGKIVEDVPLMVSEGGVTDSRIRQFHKGALRIAREAIDLYPTQERHATALLMPLDDKSYAELIELISEFGGKLQKFAEDKQDANQRLYQLIVNLSPTGGISEKIDSPLDKKDHK